MPKDERTARIAALISEGRSHDEIAATLGITPRRLYQIKAENDAAISEAIEAIEASDRDAAIDRGVTVRRAVEITQSGSAFAREMAALAAQYTPESIAMLAEIRDNPDARTQDKLRAIELLSRIAGLSTDFVSKSLSLEPEAPRDKKKDIAEVARTFRRELLGIREED